MSRRITTIVVLMLVAGAFLYAASGRMRVVYHELSEVSAVSTTPPQSRSTKSERRMVDMIADDSYFIDRGDSTIFILVGNFAAHHNGAVILADSAVRYSNQSFECFGNVLINQNETYVYGDRAEYNHNNSRATVFSDLVKVVDGDAVMYTYHCTFDTYDEVGEFYGGCYVEKGENLMESERGYYNTKTHDLIAVRNVEMRNDTYQMTGDSVIFNTQSEDARYFRNTNIWNDKDEYLYADDGEYTKLTDLHHLKRNAYILTPEREIWGDTLKYYRTDEHIIGMGNLQVDDTTEKVLGFADYGEWWQEPGNAFFTRRPSMINYDPSLTDSIYLSADTVWLYTISAAPKTDSLPARADSLAQADRDAAARADSTAMAQSAPSELKESAPTAEEMSPAEQSDKPTASHEQRRRDTGSQTSEQTPRQSTSEATHKKGAEGATSTADIDEAASRQRHDVDSLQHDTLPERLQLDSVMRDTMAIDTLADSLSQDSVKLLTAKQLKYRAKLAKRAERDSLRAIKRAVRDSLDSIKQHKKDSIRHIRDSILQIKIDTIIARRKARSAEFADQEKERMERVKQKAEERRRRKIDKAKARALKRGKEYTGEEYTIDSITRDSLPERPVRPDSTSRDTLAQDSLVRDSLDSLDSLANITPPIPADSVYRMIKAYRNVRMFRTESQLRSDSLVTLNTDSVIRIFRDPILWNENNQIMSDSMYIYTFDQAIERAHFMGDPFIGMEIDTAYYNQVRGKDMVAYFEDGNVVRNDVDGNAQTIYYMQDEEGSKEVSAFTYIESSGISFYFDDGEIYQITYRQNPDYSLYPMSMIPETQDKFLPDFKWCDTLRPTRESICDREIRPSRREDASVRSKPTFPITERINYERRRLVENRMWVDRLDELTPEVVEWRNSRPSYQKRK